MFTSVKGKIDGGFMSSEAGIPARTKYGSLREFYNCDAMLYGTVTMAGGFSDGLVGKLPASEMHCPKETWISASEVKRYAVAVDPKGTLSWDSPYMEKPGRPKAHMIEALTEQVSENYLAYLRQRGVSYIVAGKEQLTSPGFPWAENQFWHPAAVQAWVRGLNLPTASGQPE